MISVKRAQTLSEYSLCLAIALIAIIAMNVYVKRGLQGRYADATDFAISTLRDEAGRLGRSQIRIDPGNIANQYEPDYASSNSDIHAPRGMSQIIRNRGEATRTPSQDATVIGATNTQGIELEEGATRIE